MLSFTVLISTIILIPRILSHNPIINTTSTSCHIADKNCDFCLSQTDFDYGTYRITRSGTYCLTEDITFNPLPGTTSSINEPTSWFPTDPHSYPGCDVLDDGAFALGFFTVISIEANNVKIDLNSYKISYHYQFYLQQRFGSIIEIATQPFLPSTGSVDFGDNFVNVNNITITNGELGLVSHHGIHSNNATNILISNLKIYDFEVAGIQLNGFKNAKIYNVQIGPSLQFVPLSAFYGNARFLSLALGQLVTEIEANEALEMPSIDYAYLDEGESMTLRQVYDNLLQAMDFIFRYYMDELDDDERQGDAYWKAIKLFKNYESLPDGASMYGILLNSYSVAVNGFGDADNNGPRQGNDVIIENVSITDMTLYNREVIGITFEDCLVRELDTDSDTDVEDYEGLGGDNAAQNDEDYEAVEDGERRRRLRRRRDHHSEINDIEEIIVGPFGDVLDVTQMISSEHAELILNYNEDVDLSELEYIGNPLSDAQIALHLFREYPDNGRDYAYTSFISQYFKNWALRGETFPSCASKVGHRDVMHNPNKGIVGLRMDGIDNAVMKNVSISSLEHLAPLSACDCIEGDEDDIETNVRGISIIDGDLTVYGENEIIGLDSWYGTAVGIDIMDDGVIEYELDGDINVENIMSSSKLLASIHAARYPFIIMGIIGLIMVIACICVLTWFWYKDEGKDEFGRTKEVVHHDSIVAYTPTTTQTKLGEYSFNSVL